MTGEDLRFLLEAVRFSFYNEGILQDEIEAEFRRNDIEYEREVRLSPKDRIDFVCGRVGLEIKINGSPKAIAKQIKRYEKSDRLDEIVLLTRSYVDVAPLGFTKKITTVWLSVMSL